jgi:trehalose synthase
MREVEVQAVKLERLTGLLTPERAGAMAEVAARARPLLNGRVVWNVNATAQGGGVAEMLQNLLAYGRGAGVDTRWLVLDGDAEFFTITKRLHNVLHGDIGDGGPLSTAEQIHYRQVLRHNLEDMRRHVHPDDIVLLHDPQTAGLVDGMRKAGAHAVWRCHIGRDQANAETERGWHFLRPFIEDAHAFIYSRRVYSPAWVPDDRLWVIPPSIDPFSVKNRPMTQPEARQVLERVGLVAGTHRDDEVTFARDDGSTAPLRRHHHLYAAGDGPPPGARLVVQVSRWDRLKDMAGVLSGFAGCLDRLPADVHLLLVGPEVSGVSDDPEGAEVLAECVGRWKALPASARHRAHLVTLPMDDAEENAHIVNAVQQAAAVVVQKSLVEGFGLTVTEAMWKGRPVLASAVGGIQDQIVHARDGVLLDDPHDLDTFGQLLVRLLTDADLAAALGAAARARVQDQFLGDRHLAQYVTLFADLLR